MQPSLLKAVWYRGTTVLKQRPSTFQDVGKESGVLTDFHSGPHRDTHKGSLCDASVPPMPGAPFPACPAALSGPVPALH